jgi:hypothetical protein
VNTYDDAMRVRERYPQEVIDAVNQVIRTSIANHPETATCECPGVEALGALLRAAAVDADPRSDLEQVKHLIEYADGQLDQEPAAGELIHQVQQRLIRAQWATARAQIHLLRHQLQQQEVAGDG